MAVERFGTNLDAFNRAFDAWVTNTNKDADKAVRALALQLFARIIKLTPVDTGRAKNNWQTTSGGQALGTVDYGDTSGAKALADLNRVVAISDPKQGIYLTNNLPYINRLEYGWSKQAPVGMVRIALTNFEKELMKLARKANP